MVFQIITLTCTEVRNIFNTVPFDLSITPFTCGYYGVVVICFICNKFASSFDISLTNSLPWSVTKVLVLLAYIPQIQKIL